MNQTALVAGHICLDLIPEFPLDAAAERMLIPGRLTAVGAAQASTGGVVANTGLALHKLGIETRLVGKVGRDLFGRAVTDALGGTAPELAVDMVRDDTVETSYTIVINPPGVDRMFLHCPGANDTFSAADVSDRTLAGAVLFHFGYPPLMRRFYEDGGTELERLFSNAKCAGATTSLDLARPDPDSPAGRVDWAAILRRSLPRVDIFTPSLDELLYMLDRERFDAYEGGRIAARDLAGVIDSLTATCLSWGAAAVLVKCGSEGCRLRTTENAARLDQAGPLLGGREDWRGVNLSSACFKVDVVGTTGAGDTTIAGLLAGLMRGRGPAETLNLAVATGACCVEAPDATSGIPSWEALETRMRGGWRKHGDARTAPREEAE